MLNQPVTTMSELSAIALRPATLADIGLLRHWDEQPQVVVADLNDNWSWEVKQAHTPVWREQLAKSKMSSPKALTVWWTRWISTMKLRSQPGPKSSWRFKTKTTAGATILAATPRATCGTLAPTTPEAPHHRRLR